MNLNQAGPQPLVRIYYGLNLKICFLILDKYSLKAFNPMHGYIPMAAQIFDCRKVAEHYFSLAKEELEKLSFKPQIAIVSKNEVSPSSVYCDLLLKDAERLGIKAYSHKISSEYEAESIIKKLNEDKDTRGILVIYPLGFSKKDEEIMDLVHPLKDIEGLHSINLGYLIKYIRFLDEKKGLKCVVPATAKAIVKIIQYYDIPIKRSLVTIVNNSMRIGKPLGLMLENLEATVVKCYDQTKEEDLEEMITRADILITAVPDKSFQIPSKNIKDGAVVIDASFEGNINYEELRKKASFMTSPENKIGKVTRAMIFTNFSYCSKYC